MCSAAQRCTDSIGARARPRLRDVIEHESHKQVQSQRGDDDERVEERGGLDSPAARTRVLIPQVVACVFGEVVHNRCPPVACYDSKQQEDAAAERLEVCVLGDVFGARRIVEERSAEYRVNEEQQREQPADTH